MKLTQFKKVIVLAMLSACYASAANATPQNEVTATANAIFSNPSTLTLNVTPISGLVAGLIKARTPVAQAEADDSVSSIISYRWTPGSGVITHPIQNDIENIITITGTNPDDKIHLTVKPQDLRNYVHDGGDGWIVPNIATSSLPLIIETLNDQKVNADTYKLSLDAAEWVS